MNSIGVERFNNHSRHLNEWFYTGYKNIGKIDGWTTLEKYRNFQNLAGIAAFTGIPLAGATTLDLGCGSGDMAPFLRRKGISDYLGVDLVEEVLKVAIWKHPGEKFVLADLIAPPITKQYDLVFLCGPLTTVFTPNRLNGAYSILASAWSLTRIGLAFNFHMDSHPQKNQTSYTTFYSPDELQNICQGINPQARVVMRANPKTHFANGYMIAEQLDSGNHII